MKTLLKDQGDAVTLQKRVMDLEMQVAELKFKFTESEFEKDVCNHQDIIEWSVLWHYAWTTAALLICETR